MHAGDDGLRGLRRVGGKRARSGAGEGWGLFATVLGGSVRGRVGLNPLCIATGAGAPKGGRRRWGVAALSRRECRP